MNKLSKFAKRMRNKQRKGFSLVELVVVILIIAILAAMLFLGGATVIGQAREREVQSDLKNFGTYVQDMLYDNPELQYLATYADGENYTYDPTTKSFTPEPTTGTDGTVGTTLSTTDMHVLNLLNSTYLTDDFQLGDIADAWGNPYCFSYTQIPATATGESSSCVIVINSLGNNSLDETSDGQSVVAQRIASYFKGGADGTGGMDAHAKQKLWSSADEFLGGTIATEIAAIDDYGVVIVMIDGQVSVGYYGFK